MNSALCCSSCGEVVFKSMNSETKLRAKVVIFRDDQAFAVCKGCDNEIPVPIDINAKLMSKLDNSIKTRLYVRK